MNYNQVWFFLIPRKWLLFLYSICVFIFIALNILFWFQFYLLITGQSSVEYQINRRRRAEAYRDGRTYYNPYDLGLYRNFTSFFGIQEGDWYFQWIVPGLSKPKGDGTRFEKRNVV